MAYLSVNGIRLAYERTGEGEPVLLIMGSGAGGRVWTMHQTPALNRAGYQTVTFDNRGIPPTDAPPGRYSLEDLVADTAGLIEALELGPCRIVGTSMGAVIAQTLAVARPDLVRSAVLIATRGRSDAARKALTKAERSLVEAGIRLPAAYAASSTVMQMLSPTTLNEDGAALWLEIFEVAGDASRSDGQAWVDIITDRRQALGSVAAPCRVIAFSDDLICPPHLAAEVAEAIPDCDYVEIGKAGHLGYLERPDEANAAIIEFFDEH